MTERPTDPAPPPAPRRVVRFRALGTRQLPQFDLGPGEGTVLLLADGWWLWWAESLTSTVSEVATHGCPITTEGWGSPGIPLLEGVLGRPDAWEVPALGVRLEGVPVRVPWRD